MTRGLSSTTNNLLIINIVHRVNVTEWIPRQPAAQARDRRQHQIWTSLSHIRRRITHQLANCDESKTWNWKKPDNGGYPQETAQSWRRIQSRTRPLCIVDHGPLFNYWEEPDRGRLGQKPYRQLQPSLLTTNTNEIVQSRGQCQRGICSVPRYAATLC